MGNIFMSISQRLRKIHISSPDLKLSEKYLLMGIKLPVMWKPDPIKTLKKIKSMIKNNKKKEKGRIKKRKPNRLNQINKAKRSRANLKRIKTKTTNKIKNNPSKNLNPNKQNQNKSSKKSKTSRRINKRLILTKIILTIINNRIKRRKEAEAKIIKIKLIKKMNKIN